MRKSVLKKLGYIQFRILNESSATLSLGISSCLPANREQSRSLPISRQVRTNLLRMSPLAILGFPVRLVWGHSAGQAIHE
jgi:hypothetical protein